MGCRSEDGGRKGQTSMQTHFITAEGRLGRLEHPKGKCPAESQIFSSQQELSTILQDWPMRRLVELWNRLPGAPPVRKFENRSIAIARLGRELERQPVKNGLPAKNLKPPTLPRIPCAGTKTASILALLQRPEGATLQEVMAVTGWQSHSVRGFISGNLRKKQRFQVLTSKRDGTRVYRIGETSR